jgi:hypothetical protein
MSVKTEQTYNATNQASSRTHSEFTSVLSFWIESRRAFATPTSASFSISERDTSIKHNMDVVVLRHHAERKHGGQPAPFRRKVKEVSDGRRHFHYTERLNGL